MATTVMLAVVAVPVDPGHWIVAALLSATDGDEKVHTKGTHNVARGNLREGIARVTAQGLALLTRPTTVTIVMRRPDLATEPPTEETEARLRTALGLHTVKYAVVASDARQDAIERAERFAGTFVDGARRSSGGRLGVGAMPPGI